MFKLLFIENQSIWKIHLIAHLDPNSFKQCQTELANFAKHIMKELQASDPVIEVSRNIVLQELKA